MKSIYIVALFGMVSASTIKQKFVNTNNEFDQGDESKEEMQMQTSFDDYYVEPAIQKEMKEAAAKSYDNYWNIRPAYENQWPVGSYEDQWGKVHVYGKHDDGTDDDTVLLKQKN